jgi:hypothetical protein
VHAAGLPSIVSQPGARGDAVTRPDQTAPDEYSAESYWWLFRRLLDETTGGAGHRGHRYAERNRVVRDRFDALEKAFDHELAGVLQEFARARGSAAAPALLAAFTASCVDRVTKAVHELLADFGRT